MLSMIAKTNGYNSVLQYVKTKKVYSPKDTKMQKAKQELIAEIEADIIRDEQIKKGMLVNLLV